MNVLQVKKQCLLIKEAKFAQETQEKLRKNLGKAPPLGKAFEKQTKTIENQDKKQIKPIEDHEKQLVESDEVIRKDFNIDRDSIPLQEKNI